MTPEQPRATQKWSARHPHLFHLLQAMITTIVIVGALVLIIVISPIVDPYLRLWPTYYQHAGGWSLRIEAPTGPPIPVDTYQSQEACEETRAWEIQQAYRSQRPIPPLSCVSKYQGWRRLLYVLEATIATQRATPAPHGR